MIRMFCSGCRYVFSSARWLLSYDDSSLCFLCFFCILLFFFRMYVSLYYAYPRFLLLHACMDVLCVYDDMCARMRVAVCQYACVVFRAYGVHFVVYQFVCVCFVSRYVCSRLQVDVVFVYR